MHQKIDAPTPGDCDWIKMSFSNDGGMILISTNRQHILVVDAHTLKLKYRIPNSSTGHDYNAIVDVEAIFTPDAKHIMCASPDGSIVTWDALTGQRDLKTLGWHKQAPRSIAFSHKYAMFATSDELSFWVPAFE